MEDFIGKIFAGNLRDFIASLLYKIILLDRFSSIFYKKSTFYQKMKPTLTIFGSPLTIITLTE